MATGFLRPGTLVKQSLGVAYDVDADADRTAFVRNAYDPNERLSIAERRKRLPIYSCRSEILYLVENHSTVVLIGETGSGKTTQVPQYLREAGWTDGGRCVVCTQPRRIAVMSVAQRVAEEVGCRLGHEVGYAIRFEDVSTEGLTALKFVTDGVLLREMLRDPLLTRYSVVVVDEAHERSLATDLLLGLLRRAQRRRPQLRIVVSSATIQAEAFADFFRQPWGPGRAPAELTRAKAGGEGAGGAGEPRAKRSRWDSDAAAGWRVHGEAAVLSVEGRLHDVQVHYLQEPCSDYVRAAVETVLKIHREGTPGDILVFLTGQEECETAVASIRQQSGRTHNQGGEGLQLQALPLYGGLPGPQQMACLEPPRRGWRKCVVATNVAETSVTIEGVVFVVDCCFAKQRVYNPVAGLESLVVSPASKQSAQQRAGRAGRVRPGHCFRLCTESDFLALPAASVPEVQRAELSGAVLHLKMLGVDDIVRFPWLSAPPAESMVRALETLYSLGALDKEGALAKPDGVRMAEMPVGPMVARSLLWAAEHGCAEEMCTVAAVLGVDTIWAAQRGAATEKARARFRVAEGDLVTALNVYEAWERSGRRPKFAHSVGISHKALLRVADIRAQVKRHMVRLGLDVRPQDASVDDVCRAMAAGFFANAAVIQEEGAPDAGQTHGPPYRLVRGQAALGARMPVLRIGKGSVLHGCQPQWVVFTNAVQTLPGVYEMEGVVSIQSDWLTELAPHYFEVKGVRTG